MTLEDLGNIGEFVGAIGVVVSLLYLAIQIRRSNLLATAESNRFQQHASNESIMAIVHDPEVARIFREGLGDRDALSSDEKVRFDMLLGSLIGGIATSMMDQELLGHRGTPTASDQVENVRVFLSAPGGAAWWAVYQSRYAPAVRSMVEEILRAATPPAA
jgi:hypothetical protein